MRELEFLPHWYSTLRQRRRILVLESWLAVFVVVMLGIWILFSARNVSAHEAILNLRQAQLNQSNIELQKLTELETLRRQMSDQATLVSRLGTHVPTGRLIDVLEKMMPKEMALLDISMEFQQQNKAQPALAAATGAEPVYDRQLCVQLHGVAPSDVDLGNFMIRLATIPHFSGSSMSTVDSHQNGHLMRDFKISFTLSLNDSEN